MRTNCTVLLLASLSLALGCSTISASDFGAEPPALNASWPGPVAVTATSHAEPAARLNANGMTLEVDLDDFSEELAGLLTSSLAEAGTPAGVGGKSIGVQVVHLDFMFQGPCIVDYTVSLGSGEVFGLQADGASKLFNKACRLALEEAVELIARDARTSRYLGEP